MSITSKKHPIADDTVVIDVVSTGTGFQAVNRTAHTLPVKEMTEGKFDETLQGAREYAIWGSDNMWPTRVREKIASAPMAGATIYRLVAMMFGDGIAYYRNSDLKDGNTTVQRAYIPEVESFLTNNQIEERWIIPQMSDYRFYMNAFTEFTLSRDGSTITEMYHKAAEHCRLERQNQKNLRVENLIYSPYFATRGNAVKEQYSILPLYTWHQHGRFFTNIRNGKQRRFAYHTCFETPGRTYYAHPFWLGLYKDGGWIDVSANVPKIVSAMQNNQISIKYQILIPKSYFLIRHPEWSSYGHAEREKIINSYVDRLNNELSSTDNQYRSITTVFEDDPGYANAQGKIEIIAIDDKAKQGVWVPDSNTADAQIVQGFGLHPSQVGLAPQGGKMGAGSGSDQRETFNINTTINTLDQKIILAPLNMVSRYNNWGVTFVITHTTHTTTNNQESGIINDPMSVNLT